MKGPHSLLILVCFALSISLAHSQTTLSINLVTNPSFEKTKGGEKDLELANDIDLALAWSSPNEENPQLYATTEEGYIYDNFGSSWTFKARTGKRVATLYVYGINDGIEHRQYIQGSLNQPLTVGKKYDFSFWVHYHCEGSSNIGIAFLPKTIKLNTAGLINLAPATYQKEVTPYSKTTTWTKVAGSFIAYKPFQNFIIGNFFSNENTAVESNRYEHHIAYIDDIIVTEAKTEADTLLTLNEEEAKQWETNEITIQNIPSTTTLLLLLGKTLAL